LSATRFFGVEQPIGNLKQADQRLRSRVRGQVHPGGDQPNQPAEEAQRGETEDHQHDRAQLLQQFEQLAVEVAPQQPGRRPHECEDERKAQHEEDGVGKDRPAVHFLRLGRSSRYGGANRLALEQFSHDEHPFPWQAESLHLPPINDHRFTAAWPRSLLANW
jgi:hypothetical protein